MAASQNGLVGRGLNYLYWRYRDAHQFVRTYIALAAITMRKTQSYSQRAHGLPYEIIVSLTSYKPRFKTLPLTLECLLRQTVKPDRIILWIDEPDLPNVTPEMRAMEARGVEIRTTPVNNGPYNKIIPTLLAFPEAIVVTVDDDIYYQADMLEGLIENWSGDTKEIVCHLGFRITTDKQGNKLPFSQWKHEKRDIYPGRDIVAFGVGGVLYPPGSLLPDVTDQEKFRKLSPKADDIWLYWMARLNGSVYRLVTGQQDVVEWPTSQKVGLKHENVFSKNEERVRSMVGEYGWPSFTDN